MIFFILKKNLNDIAHISKAIFRAYVLLVIMPMAEPTPPTSLQM
jgi:hypothetical protein